MASSITISSLAWSSVFPTYCLKYESAWKYFTVLYFCYVCVPDLSPNISRNALKRLRGGFTISFGWFSRIVVNVRRDWRHLHICDKCSVSVANNFVHPQSTAVYQDYAFVEVTHFVYCLLQKTKKTSVLPLVELWEEPLPPNSSKIAAIDEEHFFAGIQLLVALEKAVSFHLKKEFRRDCSNFLDDFMNCVLSTVAARSSIVLGLSCFCHLSLIGSEDHAPMQLFNLLLDRLLEKGCWGALRWRPADQNASRLCKSRSSSSGSQQGAALI